MPKRRFVRLRASRLFREIRAKGRSAAGKWLIMNVQRIEGESTDASRGPAAGFVTSRKVGRAHDRNLVRRRLREVVHALASQLQSGLRIVTIARHSAARASFNQLLAEWRGLASRLGALNKGPSNPPPTHGSANAT
jgi:ribonuclease P protein component